MSNSPILPVLAQPSWNSIRIWEGRKALSTPANHCSCLCKVSCWRQRVQDHGCHRWGAWKARKQLEITQISGQSWKHSQGRASLWIKAQPHTYRVTILWATSARLGWSPGGSYSSLDGLLTRTTSAEHGPVSSMCFLNLSSSTLEEFTLWKGSVEQTEKLCLQWSTYFCLCLGIACIKIGAGL